MEILKQQLAPIMNKKCCLKKVRTLVVNYPDFINCEILSIEPIDEMGYFKVKSKIVLDER